MPKARKRFQSLSDQQLLDLLHSAGDRLPREAVDECLRRAPRLEPHLRQIVAEKASWTQPLPEWWAPVHATYILGAAETPASLPALLAALRWADAFDCDWVAEDLPSILAHFGPAAWAPLATILDDVTAGWGARSIALCALTALAVAEPGRQPEIVSRAASLLSDKSEDYFLRQAAANVLLDLRVREHRDLLRAFGREEAGRRADDPEYQGAFYDWEVDEILEGSEGGGDGLDYYRRDWMEFYDPEEIERRQERWVREQEDAEDGRAEEPPPPRPLPSEPCPCGSGLPFEACCYLKVH